ncbi:MAG: glycosyltransferase family 4 protein, partial [Elusimicrobiota bacterium]
MAEPSVVMVSASFHPYVGGAEKQALELSVALRQRGVRVRVLTRGRPGLSGPDEVRGVPVERLACFGPGFINAVTFMLSLGRWLWVHAAEYSVVHVHLAGSPALPAALAGRFLKKRVVIKLGGGRGIGELAASSGSWSGRLKLWLLARLRPQFVAVTRDLAEECVQYLGPVPLRVLPNGVDVSRYKPAAPEAKAALRRGLGWPAGLGFLYVGRLSPEKQLRGFLQAWTEQAQAAAAPSFL